MRHRLWVVASIWCAAVASSGVAGYSFRENSTLFLNHPVQPVPGNALPLFAPPLTNFSWTAWVSISSQVRKASGSRPLFSAIPFMTGGDASQGLPTLYFNSSSNALGFSLSILSGAAPRGASPLVFETDAIPFDQWVKVGLSVTTSTSYALTKIVLDCYDGSNVTTKYFHDVSWATLPRYDQGLQIWVGPSGLVAPGYITDLVLHYGASTPRLSTLWPPARLLTRSGNLCGGTNYQESTTPLVIACSDSSQVISSIQFASFGHPQGTFPNITVDPSCHNANTSAIVFSQCANRRKCRLSFPDASVYTSGCPWGQAPFWVSVVAVCASPPNKSTSWLSTTSGPLVAPSVLHRSSTPGRRRWPQFTSLTRRTSTNPHRVTLSPRSRYSKRRSTELDSPSRRISAPTSSSLHGTTGPGSQGRGLEAARVTVPLGAIALGISWDLQVFSSALASQMLVDTSRIASCGILESVPAVTFYVLPPADPTQAAARAVAVAFQQNMQLANSTLRSIPLLAYAPPPPINVTVVDVTLSRCSDGTYVVVDSGICPPSPPARGGATPATPQASALSLETMELIAGVSVSVFCVLLITLCVRCINLKLAGREGGNGNELLPHQVGVGTTQETYPATFNENVNAFALPHRSVSTNATVDLGTLRTLDGEQDSTRRLQAFALPPRVGDTLGTIDLSDEKDNNEVIYSDRHRRETAAT